MCNIVFLYSKCFVDFFFCMDKKMIFWFVIFKMNIIDYVVLFMLFLVFDLEIFVVVK